MTAPTATSQKADTGAGAEQSSPFNPGEKMRAITQDQYGDSSVLSVSMIDRPTIDPSEVLIAVRAAGLDRGTEHLMTGLPYLMRLGGFGFSRPKQSVLGLDVAGVVVEIGAEVTRFAVGDEVFGVASGSFAEFAAAPEAKLVIKPSNISFEEAAVSTISGITALQALTDIAEIQAGQRVLVIGASGGVGSFAVQLTKALGGIVDGVAGTANLDLVTSFGADKVYDYRTTDISDIPDRYDVILDIGGRNPISKLRSLLTEAGTLVFIGGEGGNRFTGGFGRGLRGMALSSFVPQRLALLISAEKQSSIEQLAEFLKDGSVKPHIGASLELDDAIDALRLMEKDQVRGKTAIIVS